MKIINKQFKIPKTSDLTLDYVEKYFENFNMIRWAIVEVTDEFYFVDGAVIE